MGVEGRDKVKALEAGAVALSGQLGKTVRVSVTTLRLLTSDTTVTTPQKNVSV